MKEASHTRVYIIGFHLHEVFRRGKAVDWKVEQLPGPRDGRDSDCECGNGTLGDDGTVLKQYKCTKTHSTCTYNGCILLYVTIFW